MAADRPVTRAEVARRAGTSTATVSYVVNNGPRNVLPETRERVLTAIAELDYRPNLIARSLRAASTGTIGMVVPDIENPFFAELVNAIEAEAISRGKIVLFGSSASSSEREHHYTRSFDEWRVDGIIVIGATSVSFLEALGTVHRPAVAMDRLLGSAVPSVGIDNVAAAVTATRHLVVHGYASIACIAGPSDQSVAAARVEGWRSALAAAGLPADDALLVSGDYSLDGGAKGATALLASADRPRAVLVSSDVQAIGAMHAIHQTGLDIPADVAVVSIDGTAQAAYLSPQLTVVQQPVDELARAAVDVLVESASGAQPDGAAPRTVTVDHRLVVRRSCGCGEP